MNRHPPRPLLALLAAATLLGCKSSTPRSDPAFAARWDELMASGARAIPVGEPPPEGEALLDSVHRSMRLRRRGAPVRKAQVVAPPAAVPQAAVPAPPPSDIVEAHLPGSQTAAPSAAPTAEPAADPSGDPAGATLADAELSRVIRSGLTGLKSCYRLAESASSDGGGKAIVRFTILPTGSVDAVNVSAPSFEDSRLPGCVSMQVRGWRFPSFQGQPMEVTYPFLFTGT